MCRIMHTVSQGSGGLLQKTADYSGGFLCCRGLSLPFPCLNAAPPSGESLVLPVKVTPKTHNAQTGSMKSTGSGQPVSDRSVLQGRDSVAHHWSHHDQQKEVDKEKVNSCVFCLFSTS